MMHSKSTIGKRQAAVAIITLALGFCVLQSSRVFDRLFRDDKSPNSEPSHLRPSQVSHSHDLVDYSDRRMVSSAQDIQLIGFSAEASLLNSIEFDVVRPAVIQNEFVTSVANAACRGKMADTQVLVVSSLNEITSSLAESTTNAEQINIDFAPNNTAFVLDVRQVQLGNVGNDYIQFAPDAKPWESQLDMFTIESSPTTMPEYVATNSGTIQDTAEHIEGHRGENNDESSDPWFRPLEDGTAQQLARGIRIRKCLDFYYSRLLNTRDDSPWSVMHHMIAWGSDAQIWIGGYKGKQVSAIGWLCANGACENERLLTLDNGTIEPRIGPGLQGHEGQFLAMLAQARVQQKQPINVDGYEFTVQDLIDQEKRSCVPNTELTFKLIGLSHYLHTDDSWKSADGDHWDIPRLIREEIRQPINGVTCGGTHRLMGMSYAVRRRMQDGLPIDGEYARAAKYTADFREFAYKLRTPEGSFSTDFFRSARHEGDMNRKLKTTGHILEWIIFSSPHEELQDPRLVRALDLLTQWLVDNRYFDWDTGPLGHAIRALALYDERVYGGEPGRRGLQVAENPPRIAPNPNKPKNRAKAAMARQQQTPRVEVRTINNPARRGMNFLRRGFR